MLLVLANDVVRGDTSGDVQKRRTLAGNVSTTGVTLARVTAKGATELPPLPDGFLFAGLPVKVAPTSLLFTKVGVAVSLRCCGSSVMPFVCWPSMRPVPLLHAHTAMHHMRSGCGAGVSAATLTACVCVL
jgi:hypothetical protein